MREGIIFDMDGTLWDSAENVAKSWNIAIERSGLTKRVLTRADMQSVMGKTMDAIADIFFPELAPDVRQQLLEGCCQEENNYLRVHGGELYAGVKETLLALKETQHLSIVSNCQKGYIEAFLDYYGLWDCVEDMECYGNQLLQKADNIRLVMQRCGLDRAVYVGDIQGDYEASCKAGIPFIHAAYGFGTIETEVPRIQNFGELTRIDFDAIYSGWYEELKGGQNEIP